MSTYVHLRPLLKKSWAASENDLARPPWPVLRVATRVSVETTRVFQNLYTAAPRSHRRSEVASEGVAKHEYEVTDEDWERIEDESTDNRVEPGRNLLPYRRV